MIIVKAVCDHVDPDSKTLFTVGKSYYVKYRENEVAPLTILKDDKNVGRLVYPTKHGFNWGDNVFLEINYYRKERLKNILYIKE